MTPADCTRFDRRLESFLAGALPAAEASAVERHAERCARCAELLRFAGEASVGDVPESFTSAILAQTSGSACGRAEALLAESCDAPFERDARDLLRIHVDRCGGCERLERSLARQAQDLRTLAEIEPDEQFVSDVLARTLPSPLPSRAGAPRRFWERWLERPRFAWEAAYVGAMAIWLAVGPTLALSAAVPEPLVTAQAAVLSDARELGGRVWQVTGKRGLDAASEFGKRAGQRYEGVRSGTHDLGRHGAELRTAVVALDSGSAARALRDLGQDLTLTWSRLWSAREYEIEEKETR